MKNQTKHNKPPRLAQWLLSHILPDGEWQTPLGDFEEFYNDISGEKGVFRAWLWYWGQIINLMPRKLINTIYWSVVMLKNYIKITLRNLLRHKGYSSINILGLATGIVCSIFILLYVLFELSYDKYHPDVDRTYLIAVSRKSESGIELAGSNMPLLAPTLKEKFPQVESAARLNSGWIVQVKADDQIFKEQGLWHANPEIFQVFSIPFIQGTPESALDRPNTAVLTEQMTMKYFGDKNPIGETIKVGNRDYEITGIIQNSPLSTAFKYEIIMSWKTVENDEFNQGWHAGMLGTACIIKLKPEANPEEFENQISALLHEYAGEDLEKKGLVYRNFLHPIRDMHLYSLSGDRVKPSASLIYVYIFSAAGLLVLLIACMNFVNLATARSANRAGEVGMRKVVGAQRRQIIWQFMGESFFISLIAMTVAVLFVLLLLPFFNEVAQIQIMTANLFQPGVLLGLLSILAFVGVTAGIYPAIFLSAFRPISILRGTLSAGSRGTIMRRVLVVGQFAISIILVIASIIVFRQITFMKNQPLGFDKEQKLVITLKGWRMITDKYELVKNEFLSHPSIINACASSGVPGSMINRTWVYPADQERDKGQGFRSLRCDHDFLKVYDVELVAGRHFQKDIPTDVHQAFIINEAGVKAFGWSSPQEALGKNLWEQSYPIIGVTKDYHWWGLQRPIEPMIMRVVPSLLRSITLTVNTSNLKETLSFVEKKYAELFPGDLYEYFFVDKNFELQYQFEERISRIFRIFTLLGLFIACLGLIGLASFVAEQRTKEIGIRKVLGASVSKIVFLLSKEFIRWVLVANVIAWPLAYLAGQKWLQNFAYRINVEWYSFVLAAVFALIIAALTVSFQAFKAATANPVDALKYE